MKQTIGRLALFALAVLPYAAAESQARLRIDDVTVPVEGARGTTRVATFTVSFTDTTLHTPVSVLYATIDGTAKGGTQCGPDVDYIIRSGQLMFHDSRSGQQVNVTICGDDFDEADEAFVVNLSSSSGAGIHDGQGQALIADDDGAPTLGVSSLRDVTEGATGTTQDAVFAVTLTGLTERTVRVLVRTVDVSTVPGACGTPGRDSEGLSQVVSFEPGQKKQQTVTSTRLRRRPERVKTDVQSSSDQSSQRDTRRQCLGVTHYN